MRHWLRNLGRPWADERQAEAAQSQGMQGIEWQQDMLEGILLAHCRLSDLDPRAATDVRTVREALQFDMVQNMLYSSNKQVAWGCQN